MFGKKHCWYGQGSYDDVACDCTILKGDFCEKYKLCIEIRSKNG